MAKREKAERREEEAELHGDLLPATAREISRAQKLTMSLKRFLQEDAAGPAPVVAHPAQMDKAWGPAPPRGRMH